MRYTVKVWTKDTRPEKPETKGKKSEPETPKGGWRNANGMRKSKGELSVDGTIQDALSATLEAAQAMGDNAGEVVRVQIEAETGDTVKVNPFAS